MKISIIKTSFRILKRQDIKLLILISIISNLSNFTFAQTPDWLDEKYRNQFFPENKYFVKFQREEIFKKSKDQLDKLIFFTKEILCQETISSINISSSLILQDDNSILLKNTTTKSYIKFLKRLVISTYIDKNFYYVFVHSPKLENKLMWKDLLNSNIHELNSMCDILIEHKTYDSKNNLYVNASSKYIEIKDYSNLLIAVFRDTLPNELDAVSKKWFELQNSIDSFAWNHYFSSTDDIIKISNFKNEYSSIAYINFDVKLKYNGYLNIFLLNNSEDEHIYNLYPNFNFINFKQKYEYLESNKGIIFPYGLDKSITYKNKFGYSINISKSKEIEECAVLAFFSTISIPNYITTSSTIKELYDDINTFKKLNSNEIFSIKIEHLTLKK